MGVPHHGCSWLQKIRDSKQAAGLLDRLGKCCAKVHLKISHSLFRQ